MQIQLCEDDGIFHDGVPTMVVLLVKFDDGKVKRIPYPAEKSISALYQDLNSIVPKSTELPQQDTVFFTNSLDDTYTINAHTTSSTPLPMPKVIKQHAGQINDKSHIIEREDIVQLIMLDPDRSKDATCFLVVGQELRVIGIKQVGIVLPGTGKITNQVKSYEVVDDAADRPERTMVFPHEVKLLRKRTPPIAKLEHKFEEMLHCPSCNTLNALALEGTDFKGTCTECQQDISIARIIKKCQTDKCGKDVSCFDVGGKYEGKCTQCKSTIEVPYA